MEYEYLTEELESGLNGLRFLNHLIHRDHNQAPLVEPITQLENLYSDMLEFNQGIHDYNTHAERANALCMKSQYNHPDAVSWLEESKTLYEQRKGFAKRFREITGDCFIGRLNGIDISPYTQEYQELVSTSFDIGKYLDQEASRKGNLPRSGVDRADEVAFARMRKKIAETGRFW